MPKTQALDKSCPFCGHMAVIYLPPPSCKMAFPTINCTNENCKLHVADMAFTSEQEARIFWNHRVS